MYSLRNRNSEMYVLITIWIGINDLYSWEQINYQTGCHCAIKQDWVDIINDHTGWHYLYNLQNTATIHIKSHTFPFQNILISMLCSWPNLSWKNNDYSFITINHYRKSKIAELYVALTFNIISPVNEGILISPPNMAWNRTFLTKSFKNNVTYLVI